MEFGEFINKVTKGVKRNFKVSNAFNIYQIYKLIRKNHWYNIGRPVTEKEFYSIIRRVNKYLADNLVNGEEVHFPAKMGKLELKKLKTGVWINKKGKLKISYPVDWNETLKLWYEDKEAYENRTVIRNESGVLYKIIYNTFYATYENKIFYRFKAHTKVRKALKEAIQSGKTDTLW